jgi:hypothetical protein
MYRSMAIPRNPAANVKRIVIILSAVAKPRLQEIFAEIAAYGGTLRDFCRDHPDVCAELGSLL